MARTVTPTGHQGIFAAGVAWLIASSANFQTLVGAGSANAALAHVANQADDTEESGSTKPRAIVWPAEFRMQKVALNQYAPGGSVDVSFEIPPKTAIESESTREDRLWDEFVDFCNTVDAILADIAAAQGLGSGYLGGGNSQVAVDLIELTEGPFDVSETRAEGMLGEVAGYFWAAVYRFHWVN